MSEKHDRHGEPTAPRGERVDAEPGREPGSSSGPADGGPGAGREADAGPEAGASATDLDALDPQALRRLLHDSVRDIEPSPEALEHLRRAVPARRARRRHAVVGAAAAALACSVAVPAMLHADFGRSGDKSMHNAGHARDHVAEQREPAGDDRGEGLTGSDGRDGGLPGETDRGTESGALTTGGSAGPDPSSSLGPVSPTCTREQLGSSQAALGEADAAGRIYGSFTVVNTSDASCTVEGDGIVLATAQGGAKSTMIKVVDHTTGDEATGLPDPAMTTSDEVVLEPNAGYVVRFAWFPREGGGTTGCATSSPSPGGGGGGEGSGTPGGQQPMGSSERLRADTGAGGAGDTGEEGGDGTDIGSGGASEGTGNGGAGGNGGPGGAGGPGGPGGSTGSAGGGDGGGAGPASSVVVTHTPDVGDPVAGEAVLPGACAGTLYRTGVLPAA